MHTFFSQRVYIPILLPDDGVCGYSITTICIAYSRWCHPTCLGIALDCALEGVPAHALPLLERPPAEADGEEERALEEKARDAVAVDVRERPIIAPWPVTMSRGTVAAETWRENGCKGTVRAVRAVL